MPMGDKSCLANRRRVCYNRLARRISTLVVCQLPKLKRRVRFPYPAPKKSHPVWGGFFLWQAGWESKRREHTKCAEENSPVDCFRRRGRVGGGSRRSDSRILLQTKNLVVSMAARFFLFCRFSIFVEIFKIVTLFVTLWNRELTCVALKNADHSSYHQRQFAYASKNKMSKNQKFD